MRICFYAPFKPVNHKNPSGDRVIATGLYEYLIKQGHHVWIASTLRCRWIFLKPWLFPFVLREQKRVEKKILKKKPDLWLTYHTYYKAPDILGPFVCKKTNLKYVIFQGMYSSKRNKKIKTKAGYHLNKKALLAAMHLFLNRKTDLVNVKRVVCSNDLSYIAPGIFQDKFRFDKANRILIRKLWKVGNIPVILSAAMFRPGVKYKGLSYVIKACSELKRQKKAFYLVIIGDGEKREEIYKKARKKLGSRVIFTGQIPNKEMFKYYSASDFFVFPGFEESLGMVFLEAQSCGLPVVAFDNGGISEVVVNNKTGFLVPLNNLDKFVRSIKLFLTKKDLRRKMGDSACEYVKKKHDLNKNYSYMEKILENMCKKRC